MRWGSGRHGDGLNKRAPSRAGGHCERTGCREKSISRAGHAGAPIAEFTTEWKHCVRQNTAVYNLSGNTACVKMRQFTT